MDKFIDEMYDLIKKYQMERGMSFAEAIGFLKLISDELSERCRKGWEEQREGNTKEPWQ